MSDSVRIAAEFCDSLIGKSVGLFPSRKLNAIVFDMAECSYKEFSIPESWSSAYVSGYALAARLWARFSDDEDSNPIVIACSPVESGKIATAAFRSPVTGRLCFNNLSAAVSSRLIVCGYAAVIIRKKNTKYQQINISKEKSEFVLAENFFASNTGKIISELNLSDTKSYILTGPSADRKIEFSSCISDGMISGRGGLGLVFRDKNLKVITIEAYISEFDSDEKTIPYVQISGKRGWAPVFNFSGRTDQRLYHLTASEIQRVYAKNSIKEKLPPYEAVLMLGSNTGCFDPLYVRERYRLCLEYGLDPVSTGNILGKVLKENTDNKKALAIITELSQKKFDGEVLKVCGLEAGPFDYRGNFSQALSDSDGNTFSLFFNSNPDLAVRDFAFWTILGENIEFGLGSCGMLSNKSALKALQVNSLKVLLFKYFPKLATIYFRPDKEAGELGLELQYDLHGSEIILLGKRCRRLVSEINKALEVKSKTNIPEYFITNPDSNYHEAAVVPFRRLSWDYMKKCAEDFR